MNINTFKNVTIVVLLAIIAILWQRPDHFNEQISTTTNTKKEEVSQKVTKTDTTVVIKPNGEKTIKSSKVSTKVADKAIVSSKKEEKVAPSVMTKEARADYSLGLQFSSPTSPKLDSITAGVRIPKTPVWITGSIRTDKSFTLGFSYEW